MGEVGPGDMGKAELPIEPVVEPSVESGPPAPLRGMMDLAPVSDLHGS